MVSRLSKRPLFIAAAVLVALPVAQAQTRTVTVLKAGKLIDAENGQVLANRTILIEDGTIKAVAEGRAADIIAVSANPLDNVAVLENVAFVMKGGVVHRNELGK